MRKFILGCLGSLIVLFTAYFSTVGINPIFEGDSLLGNLNAHPRVLKSLEPYSLYSGNIEEVSPPGLNSHPELGPILTYDYKEGRIPILFQNRHSGLSYILFKPFYKFLSPINALHTYSLLFNSIFIILLGLISYHIWGVKFAIILMAVSALDPVQILNYNTLTSEVLNKIFFILGFYCIYKKKTSYLIAGGLVLGLGIFNKMTFAWSAALVIILSLQDIKQLKYILLGMTPPLLAYLYLIDIPAFMEERQSVMIGFAENNINHYPIKDLMNLIWNKYNFHRVFFDQEYIVNGSGMGWGYMLPSFFGAFNMGLFLYPLFFKKLYKIYFSLIIFTLLMWVSVPTITMKSFYFVDINLLVNFAIAFSLSQIRKKEYFLLWLAPLLSLMTWVYQYNIIKPLNIISINQYQKIIEVTKDDEHLFLVGENDVAIVEYLTKNKTNPMHIIYEYDFPTGKSYCGLMSFFRKGTLVVAENDPISDNYWIIGKPEISSIIQNCGKIGVKIEKYRLIKENKGHPGHLVINFAPF